MPEPNQMNIDQWSRWLAGLQGGVLGNWRWSEKRIGSDIVYSFHDSQSDWRTGFSFLSEGDGESIAYLAGNVEKSFELGTLAIAPTSVLSIQPRLAYLQDSSRGIAYNWEGCFINEGQGALSEIELRLLLMFEDKSGTREAAVSKERHHTTRSGIPRILEPGDFFCTKLKTSAVSKVWQERDVNKIKAVIDARWKDSRGFWHSGPVYMGILSLQSLTGKAVNFRAIVSDATFYDRPGRGDKILMSGTQLVFASYQKGRWLKAKSFDGKQGWIKADCVSKIYKGDTPVVDQRALDTIRGNICRNVFNGRYLCESVVIFPLRNKLLSKERIEILALAVVKDGDTKTISHLEEFTVDKSSGEWEIVEKPPESGNEALP